MRAKRQEGGKENLSQFSHPSWGMSSQACSRRAGPPEIIQKYWGTAVVIAYIQDSTKRLMLLKEVYVVIPPGSPGEMTKSRALNKGQH